ncbi:tigger transposable element-derived protein 1-like [Hemiscyllium ocellatum]|uniref:tigger transposable element-derived protein 1-like n=1 Tax=Hemiscyllium ocellatum TaxID=170820 RepID=UPI0029673AB6|nr:tigger transposable element-derived protein 1-like [Hemiscyllium ocellatum]
MPGSSDEFKASRGWFENFKKRTGIYSVVAHGEAASSNVDAAENFVKKFNEFVNTEGYVAQQVFNCDEAGLFWKKMTRRTYVTKEEKSLPGHKPMKDRLTLLLCGNASGDCKIKLLIVYHSENPRVFKKNNVMKSKFNVMWRANMKAWVTRQFFTKWIHEEFDPAVKAYLEENNLPLKALLVMDNAPSSPPGLEEDLVGKYSFIKVKFLSPNTTPLIQPMDQQVISNFKKLYTKAMFQRRFKETNETELTLRDFRKDHYNNLHCLRIIDKVWREVSLRSMISAWKKLWPECVAGRDFEGFEEPPVVPVIVSLGKSMGLEVSEEDVEELIEDLKNELTTEELQHLHKTQQEEVAEEISSEEEERASGNISSAEIKELCFLWSKAQAIVEKWHPNKAVVNRSINMFNDNVINHFRKIQKSRQHQTILERWFSKESQSTEPQPSTSGLSVMRMKRKRQQTPEPSYLMLLWKVTHFPSSKPSPSFLLFSFHMHH